MQHSLQRLFPIAADLNALLQSESALSQQPEHLLIEQDLLTNPNNQQQWLSYIQALTEETERTIKDQRGKTNETELKLLGNKLCSEEGRRSYQILVSVYERALFYFPRSFKLWNDYLKLRHSYILGQPSKPFVLTSNKKRNATQNTLNVLEYISKPDAELQDNERDMDGGGSWQGHLDSGLGWLEWRALASAHERSLAWLPMMPRLWLSYLTLLTHPSCPAPLSLTHTRRTFDRALRTLPHTLHQRIWKPYLRWAEQIAGGETCIRVWRRYLAIDPSLTAHYVKFLIGEAESRSADQAEDEEEEEEEEEEEQEQEEEGKEKNDDEGRENKVSYPSKALIAAKLLLGLVRKSRKGKYKSPDGKSPYQLLLDFMELCEKFPSKVGISLKETIRRRQASSQKNANGSTAADGNQDINKDGTHDTPAPFNGLIRMVGAPVPINPRSTREKMKEDDMPEAYDPDIDPSNSSKLDIERIIELEGLNVYKDQTGLIFTNLATYWIKRTEFEKAKDTFEDGIARVMTIRDFTTIFDAYAEFSEQYISTLMDSLGDDNHEEEEEKNEQEMELDQKMKEFEELMDRRPFLVNDVLLRRNPNDVQEWEKRVVLFGEQEDEKVVETYLKAIATINPKKATANFNQLLIHFAKWYEENGVSELNDALPDLENARKVFERAVNINYQRVDDLAEVWIEWAEMEVRNENYSEALRVMRRATMIPVNYKKKAISFHDESLAVQVRLFKSLKLWSFRVDLEESIGTVESTQKAYDSIFELKIANAQIVVNYANFLEEHEFWEESFKVYERGIELFSYPIVFEIWNTYLSKFIKRYGGAKMERARDLFEQALETCPEKFVKPIFLLYAQLEESHGLAKRAMAVLERATEKVALTDRFEMFTYYIAKATENFGLPATRPIYEKAIKCLPNSQTAEMCLRFASLEQKLGEIDRARAIYAHSSQFCDPRTAPQFWETYHNFEIQHGSEDTFREMLRIKRAVQASFNTETSYLAAKAAAARAAGTSATTTAAAEQASQQPGDEADPMSRLENGGEGSGSGNTFVLAKERQAQLDQLQQQSLSSDEVKRTAAANADEIAIDDDDEED
ncbi:hypothetical protein PCANC_19535 [Puccinia coronata f. sp. avenae]|uniref:Pre-mRNA-splicing factor SYF1 n=1 Tax=Puccinia coronata f. sp. avenae TaxID=200324 RepID=A0A2N5SKL9_9BASI|nr:hypothetical protein PCANC_19535 [Puccinia coronata f. sp. avenae]